MFAGKNDWKNNYSNIRGRTLAIQQVKCIEFDNVEKGVNTYLPVLELSKCRTNWERYLMVFDIFFSVTMLKKQINSSKASRGK